MSFVLYLRHEAMQNNLYLSSDKVFLHSILVALAYDAINFFIVWLNRYVNAHYPYEIKGLGRMFLYFVCSAFLLLFFNAAEYAYAKYLFVGTVDFRAASYSYIPFLINTLVELVVLCLILISYSARYTIKIYREAENIKNRQEVAELKALKNQLSPHFLFNSLNALIYEIDNDAEKAKTYVSNLAEVYRYVLRIQDRDLVPLLDEIDFAHSYIYLHKVRLDNSLVFSINYPSDFSKQDLKTKKIPSLALQTLVENAIKHNIINEKYPLKLEINFTEDFKYIFVKNSLKPKKTAKSTGVGLKNLNSRYKILANTEISVEKLENSFVVKLPLLESE